MSPSRSNPFTRYNLRDLGGRRGLDGRMIHCGRLYRAGRIYHVAPRDRPWLDSLGLRTVLDLRRADERTIRGFVTEKAGMTCQAIDLLPTPWRPAQPTPAEMPEHLAARYRELAEEGVTGQNPVGQALLVISEAGNAPLAFHCAEGRDRTGVLAALVLALLGVDDAEIADDYAAEVQPAPLAIWLQAACRRELPLNGWALNRTPRRAMLLFLDGLRQQYGSVEQYAGKAGLTGAELDSLRDHLLA